MLCTQLLWHSGRYETSGGVPSTVCTYSGLCVQVDQATAGFGEVVAKQLARSDAVGDDGGCAHEAAAGASSGAGDGSGAGGGVSDAAPDDATLATWFPLFEEVELDTLLEMVEGVPNQPAPK